MLSAGNILPAPFKRVSTAVHSALRRVLDLALPPLCAACREPVEGRGLCPAAGRNCRSSRDTIASTSIQLPRRGSMKGTIDRSTAKLVPADGKEVFFWDDTLTGFGLRAHAARDGSIKRAYFIQYKIGQQQRRYRIGDPEKIDAAAARKRAKELFAQVTLGVDPAAKEEEKKEKTFSQVIERYLTEKKVKPHSFHILKAYLTGTYFKPLHGKALTKIVRTDITACLTDIKAINGHVSARCALSHLKAFFAWCMSEGLIEQNPTIGIKGPPQTKRDRVLSEAELKAIWDTCADDDYGKITKLLMLTGMRRCEVGGLRWSEIDLRTGIVVVPASRTKNARPLQLTLPPLALDITKSVEKRVDHDNLFGSQGHGGFTSWQRSKRDFKDGIEKPWVLHDLRRSFVTGCCEIGIQPHIVEAAVNHVAGHKASVAGTYNYAAYKSDIREALLRWSDHIESVVTGRDHKVLPFAAST
jgi:integrase